MGATPRLLSARLSEILLMRGNPQASTLAGSGTSNLSGEHQPLRKLEHRIVLRIYASS
jgi:hypothetical protein